MVKTKILEKEAMISFVFAVTTQACEWLKYV